MISTSTNSLILPLIHPYFISVQVFVFEVFVVPDESVQCQMNDHLSSCFLLSFSL